MNKQEIEKTIANVEQQLASLKAELLKQANPEPPKKWKRKGDWVLMGTGTPFHGSMFSPETINAHMDQGRTYETLAAAESVAPYDAFYGLLCGLACELNPSGKVGGSWYVYWKKDKDIWETSDLSLLFDITMLFETEASAVEATKILNRDGIKPPQIGGVK